MAEFWNKANEILGFATNINALRQNSGVSTNISKLEATLPRARLLIDRSERLRYIYKPIEELLPKLKEAVYEAQITLDEYHSQKRKQEGANWRQVPGELFNNFKNWVNGFPEKVISAQDALLHMCDELEKICNNIGQSAVDGFRQNSGVSTNILKLEGTLPRARLLIERSECWRYRHKPIEDLLPQLKEAVYEAQITLDEYHSEKQRQEGANWGQDPGEVFNWVTVFPQKVISAQDALLHMCDQLEKTCNDFDIPQNPKKFSSTARPITSSDHPKIYGLDKELDDAIRLLRVPRSGSGVKNKGNKSGLYIGESSGTIETKRKLAILPIVGMGGVGKTTLAQMVYNDKRVQSYFNLKAWICVSDQFDLTRLTKEVVEYVRKEKSNLTNLNLLQETLKKVVKSKRVLLVLDDIWSKDWQRLLGPMNEAFEGSAIILTTRDPDHVAYTGSHMTILDPIRLEGLEENIYWDFFRSCAGLEIASENNIQLEDIAREICRRLKGSPLAAITLGGLLRKRIDKQQWINIRDSRMWELKQEEEHHIMPVLRLSYQHLPSHLKKCFSFCSLYPKDHGFTDIELANFWIMEGFIPKQENLQHMEVALGYFHDLKNSCFFHSKESNKIPEIYVIHDLMHDVCQSITKDECYCLEDENFEKISVDVHHISVFQKNPNPENLREKMHRFKKVQSLVASPNCGFRAIKSLCTVLTSIHRLSLRKCNIKNIPENIGNLKHLQYLDISQTQIQNLPDCFFELYNLQYLDMSDCQKICSFPNGMNKLTGLQFFRPPVYWVPSLNDIPNLKKAMQLYNVTYKVGEDGINKIQDIKHLIGVRGFLDIEGHYNISGKEAAEEAELNKLEHLHALRLRWFRSSKVLEALRPHFNLVVLELDGYKGLSPSWMGDGLPNLSRLCLQYCWNVTILQLPRSVNELVIYACHRLKSLQDCLQPNLVPKLKCLEIYRCFSLVSLPVESFCEFVFLEKLKIEHCENLKCAGKMVLPPSIKLLSLERCGELEKSIPSCLQNLTSLEDLQLIDCKHIVFIPDEVTRNLNSLRRLTVLNCENLASLIWCGHIVSLERFGELKKARGRNPADMELSALRSSASAPCSPDIIPSYPHMPSFEAPSTDVPSSSNVRKRKHTVLYITGA